MSIFDIFRKLRLSVGRGYHSIKRVTVTSLNATTGYSSFIPEQLVIAPQDLRTTDSIMSEYFAQGQFNLGGHSMTLKVGESPFDAPPIHPQWYRELHQFGWLRHFRNEDFSSKENFAQVLIKQWSAKNKAVTSNLEWDVDVASLRLIAWLCHSITILKNADPEFHDDFMRITGIHIRYLHRHATTTRNDLTRLYAHLALVYAALCRETIPSNLSSIENRLSQELERQIRSDGIHLDRNPATVLELLALLLPLREAYAGRGKEAPQALLFALAKLFLGVQFFRLGDGNLARFNGSGITEIDLLTTVTRYDARNNEPILRASESGYERLEMGDAILIMDVGAAPAGPLSETCNAGCLSFEFSSGNECIIINAGAPIDPAQFKNSVWRKSTSHSTTVMNETSSCKFDTSIRNTDTHSGQFIANKLRVDVQREDAETSHTITAAHLGYVREFGARHERKIELSNAGKKLYGVEWFSAPDKGDLRYSTKDAVNAHFHLHPDVSASMSDDREHCILTLRSGKKWDFSAEGFTIRLEDSTYFANHSGPRKSSQIVVSAKISNTPEIKWVLEAIQ